MPAPCVNETPLRHLPPAFLLHSLPGHDGVTDLMNRKARHRPAPTHGCLHPFH